MVQSIQGPITITLDKDSLRLLMAAQISGCILARPGNHLKMCDAGIVALEVADAILKISQDKGQ